MGCCISSKAKTDPHHPRTLNHRSPPKPLTPEPKRSHVAVTPPPPSLEEETVKEVLSETPIPKPPQTQTTPLTQQKIAETPTVQEPKSQPQTFTNNKRIKEEKDEEEVERTPEVSQASELCSLDTYSTATTATTTTTTVTEIREDEVTSKKRVNRSPAKVPRKRPYNGERERGPKLPARMERPPVKRELSGQARSGQRNNVGSSRVGRDLGERSGRRSRSPATRTSASGALKGRAGGSPWKLNGKSLTAKSGDKPVEEGEGSEGKKVEKSENDNVSMQQQGNESLDNPLVSLECFIFL
ncbi:hypothetical protein JCGZ_25831 [Jatropha curcas]|uniref:Uncharacterized protein n=1 Tax=Jatropha curcas TaxID=180498 RepID=A0A067JXC5_JATCU|nr:serine/arginine repetitive matrix protein 1 [Jatropha curcas]KDP24174.1 hypothetical protein JCGZ_25831 [Jatropha curcas]